MADVVATIAQDIQEALDKDQLDLPSLPEVALRIREEAESENVSAISLGEAVSDDPALTAQLVRIANSPMFRATRSIDDVSQAISRLGVEYAANIVTGLAMQHMFQATSDMVDRKIRQVWKSATEVAAWCSILTKRYTKLRPDQATLAGLTHSIGTLPILGWAEENDHLIRDSLTLDQVIDSLHPTLGTMILKHWNFAQELITVPTGYLDLERQSDAVDYVDLVCAANLLSLMNSDHPLMATEWQQATCFGRIGFSLDMDDDFMQEIIEDVASIKGVLG